MFPLPSSAAGPWRRRYAGLLAMTAALALGACGTEDSFAPAGGTPAAADHTSAAEAEATPSPATVPSDPQAYRVHLLSHRPVGRVHHGPVGCERQAPDHQPEP